MDQVFNVVGTLVENDGKFLFIEESKPGREGLFNVPAGKVDDDETMAQAAIRETEEESGYEIEITGLVAYYQSIHPTLNAGGLVFSGRVIGGSAQPSDKHPSVNWFTHQEVKDLYEKGLLFAHYSLLCVEAYVERGPYPLETVSSIDYRSGRSSGS